MPLEELVGIPTIYEQVIQNDVGSTKGKSLALKSSQKNVKNISSKALEAIDDISEEESYSDEDDEILLLTNKLRHLVKKRGNYKSRRFKSKEGKEIKDKIICYGCKKPGHLRSECPDRVEEKEEKEKKKFSKKKKSLMSTWENLDSSSSDTDEELNIGLMADEADNSMSEDSDNEGPSKTNL